MSRYLVNLGIVLAVLISSAQSDEPLRVALARCASIKDDAPRLQCYDRLARSAEQPITTDSPKSAPIAGKWQVDTGVNPIDDTKLVTLFLEADTGQSKWGNEPVKLVIRCISGKTELFVAWNDYLGDSARVLSRIGSEDAETRRWPLSTDHQATFYPGNTIEFVNALLTANRLVLQVTPYNENPITAVFDLAGIQEAIRPLKETCKWQAWSDG